MTSDSKSPEVDIAESLPDRIKLNRQYDVERLRSDVQEIVSGLTPQFYVYYSPIPLVNEVEVPASHDWLSENMLKGCPYLHEIFSEFETQIKSIRLMRLEAGAELQEHTDPTLDAVHRDVVRLTLPVFSDEHVLFMLNGSVVPMKPGELWYLKLSERHSVHNNSPTERINMSIDVAWNKSMENWLSSNVG